MKGVRTFFVCYRAYAGCGEYFYHTSDISLKPNEKANQETFNKILNALGGCDKEVLSWSLIEE